MPKPYWNILKTQEKSPWPKVGVAFLNRDGSYNIKLKGTINVADKLQMRQAKQKEQVKQQGAELGA